MRCASAGTSLLLFLVAGMASCGESPVLDSPPLLIDFGEVPAGARVERTVVAGAWRDGFELVVDHPELEALVSRRGDDRVVRLTWAPERLGGLSTAIEIKDVGASSSIEVVGRARAPSIEIVPEVVELGVVSPGEVAWAPLWIWSEIERPVRFGGLPVCGDEVLCVRTADGRIDPGALVAARSGLPQALAVRAAPVTAGPIEGTVVLRSCDDPACTVEVPVRARAIEGGVSCTPSVLSFGTVAAGGSVERKLTCTGADLREAQSDLSGIELIESSSNSAVLRFSAGSPGIARGLLEAGSVSVPLLANIIEAPPCVLDFGPAPLVFGAGSVGHELQARLRFVHRGEASCLLGETTVTPERVFSLPPPGIPARWLEPGVVDEVPVRFHPPERGLHGGVLTTYGPERIDVPLEGAGVEGVAEVRPRAIDFGAVSSCLGRSAPLLVENLGDGPLWVGAAELAGRDPDAFDFPHPLPEQIGAGGATIFSPRVLGTASGTVSAELILTLETSASEELVRVSLRAVATPDSLEAVDEFEQLGRPEVDLLLVVEPVLGSAEPVVRSNLEALADHLEEQELSAQVAMITPRAGAPLLGPPGEEILTSTDASDLGAELSSRLSVSTSTAPSEGLAAALAVLTSTTGVAARLVRQNAVLAVIAISPVDDQSPGDPDDLATALLEIKGLRNTNLFSFSAVAGELPNGCMNGDVSAEPAHRYAQVADMSGGVFESFCTADWSRTLTNLGTVVFGYKTRFFLTNQAIPETIEVEIDGVPEPATGDEGQIRWSYDFSTNSINFSPFAVPAPGAHLVVRYRVGCV